MMQTSERSSVSRSAAPGKEHGRIEVDAVSKVYHVKAGPVHALDDISFAIEPGELVSLVGASGCGKSTLLRIIAGLTKPTDGTVSIAGEPVRRPQPDKLSVVFQEDALLPWYTIKQNVELGLKARKTPSSVIREKVGAALDLVGLSRFTHAYPSQLSGGMRQRAALARGFVMEPDVMLLDEPFAALDEQTRNLMGQELRSLHTRIGGTMIMVTHSLTEAVLLADRVIALSARPGRLRTVLDVDLPSSRPVELIDTAEFGDIRNELWQQLEADWRLADDD